MNSENHFSYVFVSNRSYFCETRSDVLQIRNDSCLGLRRLHRERIHSFLGDVGQIETGNENSFLWSLFSRRRFVWSRNKVLRLSTVQLLVISWWLRTNVLLSTLNESCCFSRNTGTSEAPEMKTALKDSWAWLLQSCSLTEVTERISLSADSTRCVTHVTFKPVLVICRSESNWLKEGQMLDRSGRQERAQLFSSWVTAFPDRWQYITERSFSSACAGNLIIWTSTN